MEIYFGTSRFFLTTAEDVDPDHPWPIPYVVSRSIRCHSLLFAASPSLKAFGCGVDLDNICWDCGRGGQ
jgi:hypothetical protein